jgi:predicted nucleotidyltransferase
MTPPASTAAPQDRALARIKAIVAEVFKETTPCTVYLFGSRATGAFTSTSDFDVAVLAGANCGPQLSLLREKLEQSTIPYNVDVVDLASTSAEFSRQIRREGVVLWTN